MQKIVPGVGVGFDVVEEHPRGGGQFGQGIPRSAAAWFAAGLHQGLGHQLGGHIPVLLAVLFQGTGQGFRVGGRQLRQARHPEADQQVTPLAADAAHLAEVALGAGLPVAEASPAAEGAFLAVVHQRRWLAARLQLLGQAGQHLLQLLLQAAAQLENLLLQLAARAGQHQCPGHRCPLLGRQQPAPEGQHQAVLSGEVSALAHQHRLVGMGPPAAGAIDAKQQGRMGFQPNPPRPGPA